jgi:hypothetical protein
MLTQQKLKVAAIPRPVFSESQVAAETQRLRRELLRLILKNEARRKAEAKMAQPL